MMMRIIRSMRSYELAIWLLTGGALVLEVVVGHVLLTRGLSLVVTGLVGLVGLVVVMVYWRLAVYGFFALVVVEGLIRLIFYTNPAVLLIKDGVLLGVYVGCWLSMRGERYAWLMLPLTVPMGALCAVSVIQLFNPYGSFRAGLVGMKVLLYYVPLVYVGYTCAGDVRQLRRLLWGLAFLSAFAASVGLIQLAIGPDAYAGLGPGFREATFTTLGAVDDAVLVYRPNSTFSYSSHYASFLLAMLFLMLAMSNMTWGGRVRMVGWGVFVLVALASLTVGQRSFYLLIPVGVMAVFAAQGALRPLLRVVLVGVVVLGLALVLAGPMLRDRAATVFRSPSGSVTNRYLTSNIPTYFAIGMSGSPLGNGLGSATLAARHVTGSFAFIENYYAKVIYEMSLVGLLVFLWFYGGVIVVAWRVGLRLPQGDLRWLALCVAAYISLTMFSSLSGNTFDYPVPSVYVWFFSGIVMRLPSLL